MSDAPDPRQELAALVAGVRAVLEDAALRGVTAEPGDVALPDPVAAERVVAAPPAGGAEALRVVRDDLGDCQRCNLCRERTNIVFGVGDPDADLVVVGEAPGFNEDRKGEPFVGKAGAMLDRMLENVLGLPRSQVYICNIVKCRPPRNRNPLPDEVDACLPFLQRQIAAIGPKVMLVLGSVAFKTLFGVSQGIMRSRGLWREYDGVPAMPTLHPAYLLRQPQDKRKAFDDLKAVRAKYDEVGGRRRA